MQKLELSSTELVMVSGGKGMSVISALYGNQSHNCFCDGTSVVSELCDGQIKCSVVAYDGICGNPCYTI